LLNSNARMLPGVAVSGTLAVAQLRHAKFDFKSKVSFAALQVFNRRRGEAHDDSSKYPKSALADGRAVARRPRGGGGGGPLGSPPPPRRCNPATNCRDARARRDD